jgi:hypothetical protein
VLGRDIVQPNTFGLKGSFCIVEFITGSRFDYINERVTKVNKVRVLRVPPVY